MTPSRERDTEIWDLSTRIFHWTLVLLVGINLFLIGPRGGFQTIFHFVAGYAIAGLLVFRLAWGFVGSPRSRFADFLRRWPVVKGYIDRLMRFDPPHSVGHNPLGGWMIAFLLSTLAGMIVTGLFAAGRRAAGPLAAAIPLPMAVILRDLHSLLSNFLIALIVAHVLGVVVGIAIVEPPPQGIDAREELASERLVDDAHPRGAPGVGGRELTAAQKADARGAEVAG